MLNRNAETCMGRLRPKISMHGHAKTAPNHAEPVNVEVRLVVMAVCSDLVILSMPIACLKEGRAMVVPMKAPS